MAVDAKRLWSLIHELPDGQSMVVADLFALGCLLHLQGHRDEGSKTCHTALQALKGSGNPRYFEDLLSALPGNEALFASQVGAHLEINRLVRQHAEKNASRPSAECEG
ncbi:hypothetical protein [Chromohalobacter israelensis]|uniref:hypothetical protein n=1 Tax=Chromohalobacter israelensis TaxID=141390 RepID=UPI00265BA68A|nr:hypothetical protein [Chromohalobacter salexigens]MDO0944831.1 hypothetical protein [Chromohalobacter salexigens]